MKEIQRKRFSRLYELTGLIPLPTIGGSQTADVKGLAAFAIDSIETKQPVREIMLAIVADSEWESLGFPAHPDKMMDALELYIERRSHQQWLLINNRVTWNDCLEYITQKETDNA